MQGSRFIILACFLLFFFFVFLSVPAVLAETIYYTREGDTLALIARNFGVSVESILAANPDLRNPDTLEEGRFLHIPDAVDKDSISQSLVVAEGMVGSGSEQSYKESDSFEELSTSVEGRVESHPSYERPPRRRRSLASRAGNFIQRIISTAIRFLGTPYRWAGTGHGGFDCSGFVMRVFQDNGIHLRRMADEQYYGGTPVARSKIEPGDLVFFSTYTYGISHVGIYLGAGRFIHSSSSAGVLISNLNDTYYSRRFIGACRY